MLNLKFPRIRGEMKTWCPFLFHLFRTWIKLSSRFVPRETILKDQQIEVPEASIVVTWAAAAIVADIVFSCKFFPQSICTCKLYIVLLWMIFCSFLQNCLYCHIICLESLFHLFFVQKFQKRNEELVHKSQPDDNSICHMIHCFLGLYFYKNGFIASYRMFGISFLLCFLKIFLIQKNIKLIFFLIVWEF